MKTLCVAVVVLSLSSVCQPAPLACEKLMKQADKAPDVSLSHRFVFVCNLLWGEKCHSFVISAHGEVVRHSHVNEHLFGYNDSEFSFWAKCFSDHY